MASADTRGPLWRKTFEGHRCGWPGCGNLVGGRLWACKDHWLQIPYQLRDKYMAANQAGPRGTRVRSPQAKEVGYEILAWILENHVINLVGKARAP